MPADTHSAVLVRMPSELKHGLQREAFAHRRSLTAEVVMRLENSLKTDFIPRLGAPEAKSDHRAKSRLTDAESTLLEAFRALPGEKQLALLSLLK